MKTALYARVSTALKHKRQNPDTQLLPLSEFFERRDWVSVAASEGPL